MEAKDLLFKEYDSAWQQLILAKESKQKAIRLFMAVVAGLTAFLIRGDLPLTTLLYFPVIEIVFMIYLLHLIYTQSCASNAFHVVEEKINRHIVKNNLEMFKFDLIRRARYIRDGNRIYISGLLARLVIIISLRYSILPTLNFSEVLMFILL